jgi:hypothetical protein
LSSGGLGAPHTSTLGCEIEAAHMPQRKKSKLLNIEFLVDGNGDITIGQVGPIRCAATAANEDQQLAALVRRKGESLEDLLQRLDAAIGQALENNVYIDELNG